MNLHGGIALIKSTWLSWMQHRSFFFLLAFGWMIPPLIYLFVWSTAAGGETIGGLTRDQFVTYYLVLGFVFWLGLKMSRALALLVPGLMVFIWYLIRV